MSTLTLTQTQTDSVIVLPTTVLYGPATTLTTYFSTTIIGLPGQTHTIFPPNPLTSGAAPTTQYTASPTNGQPIQTFTATEYDILVQALSGAIWTTLHYDEQATPTSVPLHWNGQPWVPGEMAIVLPNLNSGWDNWTSSAKGGLLAGVLLAVLLVVGLGWWRLYQRRQEWVVHSASAIPGNAMVVHDGYSPYYRNGYGYRLRGGSGGDETGQ